MIDLCYWPTPNGHKITLLLEECGLECRLRPVNNFEGEQFALFGPGAILLYLAEKTGLFVAMERRLRDRDYLAGDHAIADMACWQWARPYARYARDLADFPYLQRWFERIAARPAADRTVAAGSELAAQRGSLYDARRVLFGRTAASLERRP